MDIPLRGWSRSVYYVLAIAAGSLTAWLKRVGSHAPAPEMPPPLPAGISVVVLTRNGRDRLERLLPALLSQRHTSGFEVIVVDGGSTDGTAAWIRSRYPNIVADISSEPLPYAKALNSGASRARYSHVCFLKSDMQLEDGCFAELRSAFERVPDLFCAAARSGNTISARVHHASENDSYILSGSSVYSMYDARLWRTLGGISEVYDTSDMADADLGFQAWRQGWPTVFVQGAGLLRGAHVRDDSSDATLARDHTRFLAHAVTDPDLFGSLWKEWVRSVNVRARTAADLVPALRATAVAPGWIRPLPPAVIPEAEVLAITGGDITVFPGLSRGQKPVVLVLSPSLERDESSTRLHNLVRCSAADYDQVLISLADDLHQPARELLEGFVEIVLVRRPGQILPALRQTVRKWRPTIVQFESVEMAQFAPDCAPARTVLVENGPIRPSAAWSQVDRIVTVSEKDRRAVGRPNAVAIGDGVDTRFFLPGHRPPDPRRILIVGSDEPEQRIACIRWFLREVWPQLKPVSPTLHIVIERLDLNQFSAESARSQPDIEWDTSAGDLRPAYSRAAVVVAPLLARTGTNVRVLEAMAMGRVAITTPAGIEGLEDLRLGHDIVIVDTSDDMAAAIAALIVEPCLRRNIEDQARATAERRYAWDVIAGAQNAMYRSLLGSGQLSRSRGTV